MKGRAGTIAPCDISDINRALFAPGLEGVRLLEAETILAFPHHALLCWAYEHTRFTIATRELIAFLRFLIGGRKAIEVCAGHGDLGRWLDIPRTDGCVHLNSDVAALYDSMGHRPIRPPPDVERIDAAKAIKRHKPQVVIGSWVPQKYEKGDTPKNIGSSIYGVNELKLIDSVECYIHVGNRTVHQDKRALKRPHATYRAPWLVSRAFEPEENLIWVWGEHPSPEGHENAAPAACELPIETFELDMAEWIGTSNAPKARKSVQVYRERALGSGSEHRAKGSDRQNR